MEVMETLLYIRALLINIYKRYETVFNFIFKFIAGLCLFGMIRGIGSSLDELEFINTYFTGTMLVLMSFVFSLLPTTASFTLLSFYITVQTSAHLELSFMLFLLMLCVILFYVRMAPKESWFILITVLAFRFNIPYIVPVFAGMYFPLTAAIPIITGVFIWDFAPQYVQLLNTAETAGFDVLKLAATVGPALQGLIEGASSNYSWMFVSFVFSMTMLIVYVVSHLSMDYSKTLAVGFGSLLCMVGLFLVNIIADVNINGGGLSIFVFSVLSMILMYVIHFFDLALDYRRAERVEFSDEDNYYFVRIIPKLILTETAKKPAAPAGRRTDAKGADAGRTAPVRNRPGYAGTRRSDPYDYGEDGRSDSTAALRRARTPVSDRTRP